MTTPPYSKTKRGRKEREKRSNALNDYIPMYFSHFFAQVNIEVNRGHQRSNLAECHNISSDKCHYLRTYYRASCGKKNSIALLKLFR